MGIYGSAAVDPLIEIDGPAGQVERLRDQPGDLVARVEAAIGVLKHHLHVTAHRKIGLVGRKNRLPVQQNVPTLNIFKP